MPANVQEAIVAAAAKQGTWRPGPQPGTLVKDPGPVAAFIRATQPGAKKVAEGADDLDAYLETLETEEDLHA